MAWESLGRFGCPGQIHQSRFQHVYRLGNGLSEIVDDLNGRTPRSGMGIYQVFSTLEIPIRSRSSKEVEGLRFSAG